MGQEQSWDPQESQSDPEEPSQPESMNKSPQSGNRSGPRSPDIEQKPRRQLWRDGGWIGSRLGSPPHGPERLAKTVWYQGENLDQGDSEDSNRKKVNSQSVWYDSDKQLEQAEHDLSTPQASGLSLPQLLEQGLSSRQLCAALSQPHAAGAQPAPSHGLATQRREVRGVQREEEVGPDWREGGVEGGREEVSNTETTYSRKSCETADIEEKEEEKPGNEEKGAKGRKKRRKKRGKRGGGEAKLSSSSSIESQSQSETQTQREQVTSLSPQSETESEAKHKTGRARVQSPTASEPAWGEETDKDAMHLPSRTESQTRDAHGPDCDVIASESSYTTPTDDGRTDLTEATASQALETKESSEDVNKSLPGPDDSNPDSAITASNLSEMDIRKADGEEIITVQPARKEVPDLMELEAKEVSSLVKQTVDNVDSMALSENERLTVAGEALASVDQTGLVESTCPKELPVRHSAPMELTEDSFLVVFPEEDTQHAQSVDSNKPVQPFLEFVHPTEAVGLPYEGTADILPLQIQEGSTETTTIEHVEHCLASKMLGDQQHKEEKRHELWVGEEGEEISWEKRSEEKDVGMVHGKESSLIAKGEKVQDGGFPSLDKEKEQSFDEDLVATAVAVVTVAIASAMASIELSQRLAGSQSESQQSASKNLPLAQDANVPTDTLEAENKPIQHPHTEPTDLFSSEQMMENVQMSEESCSVELELECETETEKLLAAQLGCRNQDNLHLSALGDTPSLPQLHKEEIQTANTQNKFLTCSLPKEEGSLLQVYMKPLPEANETTTDEVDSRSDMQTESQLSCPVRDTGQDPETPDTLCSDSESENTSLDVSQKEISGQLLGSQFQNKEMQDRDGSLCVESPTAAGTGKGQAHEQGSPENSKTEESESSHEGVTNVSGSDCQTEEHPQLLKTPCEGESPTSTLPFTPCDSTSVADPSPNALTAPVNAGTGEIQSSQSLLGMELVAAMLHSKDESESVAVADEDGVSDKGSGSVDGWKQRERANMEREEEARKKVVTVEDTSHTGK
ncbi:A-kinase anchor protein 13-like isoform X1 [Lates japonicus]